MREKQYSSSRNRGNVSIWSHGVNAVGKFMETKKTKVIESQHFVSQKLVDIVNYNTVGTVVESNIVWIKAEYLLI